MVADQLNLKFLNEHLSIHDFDRLRACYDQLLSDSIFQEELLDKSLGAQLFINSIPEDFFLNTRNLKNFLKALPDKTQNRIATDLGISDFSSIRWSEKVSKYFITTLGIPSKFAFISNDGGNVNASVRYFDSPDLIFKTLKEYQSTIYFAAYGHMSMVPYARCIIKMPTGSGKTRTAMQIVCSFLNDFDGDVLWLANTQELCGQAFESFNEVWTFIGKKQCVSINHVESKESFEGLSQNKFHVATIQSFSSSVEKKVQEYGIQNLQLVVVDEAHISIAPTYKKSISELVGNGAKLLGLTATPGRQLRSNDVASKENQELSDFYFNEKYELNTGDESPIDFLRSKGILANAKFIPIEGVIVEELLSQEEITKCLENKTIPAKLIDILADDNRRNSQIFSTLCKHLDAGKKIIFFGTNIKHSKMMSTLANLRGYRSAHVDGGSGNFRKTAIRDFKAGKIQLLCNYGVLSTGFDDPKIDVVFMARPTNSIVLYSQIIGRGLRGPLIGGTDNCEIISVMDNLLDLPQNQEIYSYFDDYYIN